MEYVPYEIKERIIDFLAKPKPVTTIALAMTNREFYNIISEKYKADIKKYGFVNAIAADLFSLGCYKLSIYFASYTPASSDGLGAIYAKMISHGSPQLLDKFIRGIMPKYVRAWPDLTGPTYLSLVNVKVIKRRCDELGYPITTAALMSIIKKGCNKAAEWALKKILTNVYDHKLAHTLLERGNTKLIKKLMSVNIDLFLKEGTITAALKGNCDAEVLDLLYGIGCQQDCHNIDNSITKIKNVDVLRYAIQYSDEVHDHTERSILNTYNVDLMATLMETRKLTKGALLCNKNAIDKIFDTPRLLDLLCDQCVDNENLLEFAISKFTVTQVTMILSNIHKNHKSVLHTIKCDTKYIINLLNDPTELAITKVGDSKIWLLHMWRFTLPSDLLQLAYKYDSIILALISAERLEIAPLQMLTIAKIGSKIRAYYSDVCSKLTPLLANTAIANT